MQSYIIDCQKLIDSGKWTEIEVPENQDWAYHLFSVIVKTSCFNDDAYALCDRLFSDKKNWFNLINGLQFSYSTLEYIITRDLFPIHFGNRDFYFFISFILERDDWQECMDLLFQNGADPNERRPITGISLIKNFLWRAMNCVVNSLEIDDRFFLILTYFLEHGADPLLEDKNGKSAMEMFIEHKYMFEEKEELMLWYKNVLILLQTYS